MKRLRTNVMDHFKKIESVDLGPQHQWIGWLYRDTDRKWRCRLKLSQPLPPDGHLDVLVNVDGQIQFKSIGRFEGGAAVVQAGGSAEFMEGRPLYLSIDN